LFRLILGFLFISEPLPERLGMAESVNLVQEKLRQLQRIESVLATTVEQYEKRKGNQPCPIIETRTPS